MRPRLASILPLVPKVLLVLLLGVAVGPADAETIPAAKAGDFIGRDVTLEGRVVAIHSSPLASVFAFAPNFAGFTATILAGDRTKFPPDLETYYSGRLVQVSGTVTAYRGKPEMTVRNPSQLTVVVDPNLTATPAAARSPVPVASPQVDLDELRRGMEALDDRMGAVEARLGAIERLLGAQAAQAEAERAARPTPVSGVRGLGIGSSALAVRQALGPPDDVRPDPYGSVWRYGTGRTVTFDGAGRVVSWTGF